MVRTRNILFHGLGITLIRLPAFLWTYVFNLGLALAFCFPLYKQLSSLLDHSLASQRISSGFDVSVVIATLLQLRGEHSSSAGAMMTSHGSVPAYLLLYFFLVPGTLFCYVTRTHASLSNLARQGILHFWRFVRITVLTLVAAAIILGPLSALQDRWADFVDDRFVGRTSLLLTIAGIAILLLVASLLRLYFDLVEVYTIQLGTHNRPSGRSDRRVRKTLGPAFRLLRAHLARAWSAFLLLAIVGSVIVFFTTRTAMHMLAQSHVWPMFFVSQLGLFAMLFMRFWQRGAEVSLVLQNPINVENDVPRGRPSFVPPAPPPPPAPTPHPDDHPHHVEMIYNLDPLTPVYPAPFSPDDPLTPAPPFVSNDPIPNPEPASPSLDEPDPGVFHHDPQPPKSPEGGPEK